MKRRSFIISVPLAGISASVGAGLLSSCGPKKNNSVPFNELAVVEKVKMAMFTMQRRPWEQGVASQAMLEKGEKELTILMAKEAVLRQTPDGRLAMVGDENALSDAASSGEAVLWAANETGDPVLKEGHKKILGFIMNKAPRTNDGIIYHFMHLKQIWSDITYMLPTFLAASGEYKEAIKQIEGMWSVLWNNEHKLLSHMWNYETNDFARKDFWGVGNGWSAAGLSRVIYKLPENMETEKKKLIQMQKELIDGCLVHMRDDGLFHDVVDKPETFIENNLSQMLAYSIYKGITGGWIDKSYAAKANKMREAAHAKVDELGLVQGVCGSPFFDRPGTATEGQAFFILMEAAYNEYLNM